MGTKITLDVYSDALFVYQTFVSIRLMIQQRDAEHFYGARSKDEFKVILENEEIVRSKQV